MDGLAAAVLRDADAGESARVSQELFGRTYTTRTQAPGDSLWNVAASSMPTEADEQITNTAVLKAEYECVILARGDRFTERVPQGAPPGTRPRTLPLTA